MGKDRAVSVYKSTPHPHLYYKLNNTGSTQTHTILSLNLNLYDMANHVVATCMAN